MLVADLNIIYHLSKVGTEMQSGEIGIFKNPISPKISLINRLLFNIM